ncbi:monooxygenase [Salmonella enterica subsp. enterica]|uniref:Monooxygenase n=1 Tax=Salmonella enterica I TaxID=59201 RepID=A0A3S4K6D7_SALET|nr:monooxygenase [Salmonella enterica subsp. enterica]
MSQSWWTGFDARDPNSACAPGARLRRADPGLAVGDPACIVRNWRPSLACRSPLLRIFAPDMLFQALHLYRTQFKPFSAAGKNRTRWCVSILSPPTATATAEFLFTSMQQAFVKLRRGETGQLPPPIENMETFRSPSEQYGVQAGAEYGRWSVIKRKVRHGAGIHPAGDPGG